MLSPLQQANNSFVWGIGRKHNNCIIVLDLTLCIRRRECISVGEEITDYRAGASYFWFTLDILLWHLYENPRTEKREGTMFWNSLDDPTMSIKTPSISKYESILNKIKNQTNKKGKEEQQSEGKAQYLCSFYGGLWRFVSMLLCIYKCREFAYYIHLVTFC